DMGGIIVIDFIDMQSSKNKQIVNEKMKECMSTDRAKHTILPLSKFGLMQITRQRVRPEMHISTTEICPACNGSGEISPSILFVDNIKNRISFILQENKHKKLIIKVHPYIAAYINKGIWPVRLRWRFQFKCKFRIIPVSSFNFLEYNILDEFGEEILH
ncbi:MAG: ribonuclease E/G, partial [Bacteroidales bacterium]